jgi:hypothetical protein
VLVVGNVGVLGPEFPTKAQDLPVCLIFTGQYGVLCVARSFLSILKKLLPQVSVQSVTLFCIAANTVSILIQPVVLNVASLFLNEFQAKILRTIVIFLKFVPR